MERIFRLPGSIGSLAWEMSIGIRASARMLSLMQFFVFDAQWPLAFGAKLNVL